MANDNIEAPSELIPEKGFLIEFPEVSTAEAGRCVEDLETSLNNAVKDEGANAFIERLRTNPQAQDLGTVLAVILGAKATVVIAMGIAKWLTRNNQSKIRIRTKDGRDITISNLESANVEGIVRAISLDT